MFCTKCGKSLNDGEVCSCQSSNTIFSNDENSINVDVTAIKDNATKLYKLLGNTVDSNNAFEKGKQIVPDCVCSNDGEIPIKQYNFAKLKSLFALSFAEGRLQVTNKRLIIRAAGLAPTGKTTFHQEFKIEEIAGVEIRKGQRFSFEHSLIFLFLFLLCGGIGLILGKAIYTSWVITLFSLILGLGAIAGYVMFDIILNKKKSLKKHYILKHTVLSFVLGFLIGTIGFSSFSVIMAIPVGILFLFNSIFLIFAPSLTAIIKTNGGSPALELKRKEFQLFQAKSEENSGFKQVLPWKDTDLVIKELGTIIDDLQTMGDIAIEKWKN